jgi:hypothetical protein
MSQPSTSDRSASTDSADRCRRLANQFIAGRITFEEYAPNVTLAIVSAPDGDIPLCVESVPPDIAASYADYLRSTLEPVDFLPCPRPFLAGGVSEEVIERTRRQLRDKYLRLYQLMRERTS